MTTEAEFEAEWNDILDTVVSYYETQVGGPDEMKRIIAVNEAYHDEYHLKYGSYGKEDNMPYGPFGRKPSYVAPMQIHQPTPIEIKFWEAYRHMNPRELRGLVPEYKIGRFRVDFAVPRLKFIIELDGRDWHTSVEQRNNDYSRQRWLESQGWYVTRFTGSQVYANPNGCVREAALAARARKRGKR